MNFCVALLLRVFLPLVGLPQGVAQCLPPLVRPPLGWSTGLRAMPRDTADGRPPARTAGLADDLVDDGRDWTPPRPSPCSRRRTMRVSPDLSFRAHSPGRGRPASHRCRPHAPAAPPLPGLVSILWTIVPTGMLPSGIALPGFTSTRLAGHDAVADRQPLRRQNVGLLAIGIFDERDIAGAVGIVFEPLDRCRDVEFAPLEVDQPVSPLVAAALAARSDAARPCRARRTWSGLRSGT